MREELIRAGEYSEAELQKKGNNELAYICTLYDIKQGIEKLRRQLTQHSTANEHHNYQTIRTKPITRQDKDPKHYIRKKKLNLNININNTRKIQYSTDLTKINPKGKNGSKMPEGEKGKTLNANDRTGTPTFISLPKNDVHHKEANISSQVKKNLKNEPNYSFSDEPKNNMEISKVKTNLDSKKQKDLNISINKIGNDEDQLKRATFKLK